MLPAAYCTLVPCTGIECRITCAAASMDGVKHLLSSHKSACRATMTTIESTSSSKPKFCCHKTGANKGFSWLPAEIPAQEGTEQSTTPYCAKQIRPLWYASSQTAAYKVWKELGCRRAHGHGEGECNAVSQSLCKRSVNCKCGLPEDWTRDNVKDHIETLIELMDDGNKEEQTNPTAKTKAVLKWWGTICTCPTSTLKGKCISAVSGDRIRYLRRSFCIPQTIVLHISDDRLRCVTDPQAIVS